MKECVFQVNGRGANFGEYATTIPLTGTDEFELTETAKLSITCDSASSGSVSKSVTITVDNPN